MARTPGRRTFPPAMFSAATRAWSAALGWMAETRWAPVKRSGASATSPAAKMPGTEVSMRSLTRTPFATWTGVASRKPTLGVTPAETMSRSAASLVPVVRWTVSGASPVPGSIRSIPARVMTWMPLDSTQVRIMLPAFWVIMRGTMRSPISTTVRATPRAARASMMMQPMNPAPSCTTRLPGLAYWAMARASARVQQVRTSGRSIPGMGGRIGCDPVAIRSRS